MIKRVVRLLIEQTLAVTLILLFVLPLVLTVVRYGPVFRKSSWRLDYHWIGRPTLSGVTTPTADVALSWSSLANGEFQKSAARRFNENFASREGLIRYTDEVWFRVFHQPANAASTITVGPRDVLFENVYLHEYAVERNSRAVLEPWVKNLRRLQDFCRSIGMGFVVMLAPTKPTIYPEHIPDAWQRRCDPEPRGCLILTELLRENGIVFIDGAQLIADEKRKRAPAPLFPKGGIHWNKRAALLAANAAQARFAEQNLPAEQIEVRQSTVDQNPHGEECDLVLLMNLVRPWKYPVERIAIRPSNRPRQRQMTMAMVGDSFSWSVLHVLQESAQFSAIGFYFYYWQWKMLIAENRWDKVRAPASPIDFRSEIFAADCLLLEINEGNAVSPEHHLSVFVKEALAHLPDPAARKPEFRGD
jgi:SGNH hydrolase-like domain, acetyltransferase AlgX